MDEDTRAQSSDVTGLEPHSWPQSPAQGLHGVTQVRNPRLEPCRPGSQAWICPLLAEGLPARSLVSPSWGKYKSHRWPAPGKGSPGGFPYHKAAPLPRWENLTWPAKAKAQIWEVGLHLGRNKRRQSVGTEKRGQEQRLSWGRDVLVAGYYPSVLCAIII